MKRKNIVRLISIPKETWENYSEIFIDLDELSPMLNETNLNVGEKIEIIMLMFEKNIATGLLEPIDNIGFDEKNS